MSSDHICRNHSNSRISQSECYESLLTEAPSSSQRSTGKQGTPVHTLNPILVGRANLPPPPLVDFANNSARKNFMKLLDFLHCGATSQKVSLKYFEK